ncbi:MAG: RagB/SusD family nutrient uptake outer membrane protein [bacterium]
MRQFISKLAVAVVSGAVLLGNASCTDLSETPFTEVTQANFKPTATDLAALIAPAYTPLRSVWMGWYGMLDFQEETADEFITPVRPNGWYDGGVYIRLHEHRWDPSQGEPNQLWSLCYSGINAANRVIYQISSGVIPVDTGTKTSVTAELRAVRAYYYSLLLDNFGNVPIVTDFTSVDVPKQSTRQELYDFVVKEFIDVTPLLSTQTGTPIYGRINQLAAKGLLARVYLNASVYTGTPQLDKVLTLTQDIVGAGKYKLDATYSTPFARTNDQSAEILFAVPYDAINANQSNFHMKTLKPDLRFVFNMQAQPWGGSASNPQFIDTYDRDDGRLTDTWLMGTQRDAQGRGYDFVEAVPSMMKTDFYNGYPVKKYEIYSGETGSSDVDYPVLRYSEVLMMRAEALLRTGQGDAAAALVTQVRQRAFKGAAAAKATVTGADLAKGSVYNYGWEDTDGVVKTAAGGTPVVNGGSDIQFGRFLDELGWEFAIEGHRRTDLIRFGVFTSKKWFNHAPNGTFRTVFAIPITAIQTNANLKQNTGY